METCPSKRQDPAKHLPPNLDYLGVRSDTYHLFGAHREEAMMLDHRPEGWMGLHSERGREVT